MMEEDFYATLKLKTGEEIFAKVAASEENEKTMLILSNPVMVGTVKGKSNVIGYQVEPWIKTSTEDMFIICLLYTSPSPRDKRQSRMPSSA